MKEINVNLQVTISLLNILSDSRAEIKVNLFRPLESNPGDVQTKLSLLELEKCSTWSQP